MAEPHKDPDKGPPADKASRKKGKKSSGTPGTHICPVCNEPIGGGSGNLYNRHLGSDKCKENVRLAAERANQPPKKTPVHASLKNWFFKPKKPVPPAVEPPPLLQGASFTPVSPTESTAPADNSVAPDWLAAIIPPSISADAQHLVRQLKAKMEFIPFHAPVALDDHPLAPFSIDPENSLMGMGSIPDSDDDWVYYLEPLFKKAFGSGEVDPEAAVVYARRGMHGLDGFVRFVDHFVEHRGLQVQRIRRYIDMLLGAIESRFPTAVDSAGFRNGAPIVTDTAPVRLPPMTEDRFAPERNLVPCIGMQLTFPDGKSHHTDYPFGLHRQFTLPWDYYSKGERFFIQSQMCTRGLCEPGKMCRRCNDLLSDNMLVGILERIRNGIPESTTFIYMPISVLIDALRSRVQQYRGLKLTRLNDLRKLFGKLTQLDEHKQFVLAVASGKVERVAQLVRACLNNKVGIRGLVERYQRACEAVYNPKGFDDDDMMLGLLILRLGGARLAGIVHRAIGLPGLSTLRNNTIIRPLVASPATPTLAEIEENIDICAEGEPEYTGPPMIVHRVLMADEIHTDERPRWDDKTNMILGVSRETSHNVPLELNSADDLEVFFNALDHGDINLASEATVAAFGALSKDPRIYSPRPCLISGTDKHENAEEHAKLLQKIIDAGHNKRQQGNIIYRTVSLASDGEARRGLALVIAAMNRLLSDQSPIHPLLSVLELMNLRVGEDDRTPDKDYRHLVKTSRNLLMRLKGVQVLGFVITPAIIKQHLRANGHSQEQINTFLDPNDKQDVGLGYQFLKSLWSLPPAAADAEPTFAAARAALKLFGQLGYHLLMPYIFIELTLHQQLVHLSTAAHLLILLYSDAKAGTSFMANQTYVNLMIMIKNVFFCVAKAKIDLPDSEFFIILLGTDRLEVLFGLIRTAIGTDSNVDIYQLANRISNLIESVMILAQRPQWDRSPRRLKLPMIINEAGDVCQAADHINPASWKGDVHVRNINLLTAWIQGREKAAALVPNGRSILKRLAQTPGVDIFSPLGSSLINYSDEEAPFVAPDPDEDFELDPDLIQRTSTSTETRTSTSPDTTIGDAPTDSSYTPDGDVEDAIAIAEPRGKFSTHIMIDGKSVSKAKALSTMMRYRGSRTSTDRLKRVAGLPSFNPPSLASGGIITSDDALGAASIRIGNPVALIVASDKRHFLAIAQVNNLSLTSIAIDAIPLTHLRDSSAKIGVQILRLLPSTLEDDPTEQNDWCWSSNSKLEGTCTNVPGNLIQPINPTVSVVQAGRATLLFDSTTLLTTAATIHAQLTPNDLMLIPKVKRTDYFPYRSAGRACFVVESETESPSDEDLCVAGTCSKCRPAILLEENGQRVLEHMAGHILFDPSCAGQQLCGLCNQPWPTCVFFFTKRRGTTATRQIDWTRSKCSNPIHFNMKTASTFTEASPCTNRTVQCSLCPIESSLVWTYSLAAHYAFCHNKTTGPYMFLVPDKKAVSHVEYQRSAAEEKILLTRWKARFTNAKRPANATKSKPQVPISLAHSSRMALRNTVVESVLELPAPETLAEDGLEHAIAGNSDNLDSTIESEDDDEFPAGICDVQAESDEFGPEFGPLPSSYPDDVDDYELEYLDGSDQQVAPGLQEEMQMLRNDISGIPLLVPAAPTDIPTEPHISEVPLFFPDGPNVLTIAPPNLPGALAPEKGPLRTVQHDWEMPLVAGPTTRSGRQTRVRSAKVGACECNNVLDAQERQQSDKVIRCIRDKCETKWYHRDCLESESFSSSWMCESCRRAKKRRT